MSGKEVTKKAKRTKAVKIANPLIKSTPKTFGMGNVQHKRDLSRYVKFPRYVRVQKEKRILMKRLKVPPAVNIFYNHTLDKQNALSLFKVLDHIKPEESAVRRARIKAAAKELAEKLAKKEKAPKATKNTAVKPFVKSGLNLVTKLIEKKQAKLVIIAHDVCPLEMVLFMPYLCKKLEVPYCIVKGKARLGKIIHKKTAACLAITDIAKEDTATFNALVENVKSLYFDNVHMYREFGGRINGFKHNQKQMKLQAKLDKDSADKAKQQAALTVAVPVEAPQPAQAEKTN
uniref:60S ribosomal protein L7a n=1 Tax=Entamoeba invadens TaxID=33085 RepID=S0B1W2_ENTIV|nr:60S ribosomal protein L7A-1, putative [Entamoeba invadens]